MSARQLRLFEHPRPLFERFGRDFFLSVPKAPGVYVMCNDNGRALYVGQSKNLRARLYCYRNANPAHVSRKTIRLVHEVCRIELHVCETPEAARLKENELLRELRPKFNTMNVFPQAHCFIGFGLEGNALDFWLTREEARDGQVFGAFKSGSGTNLLALARLIWLALWQPARVCDLPRRFLGTKAPSSLRISAREASSAEDLAWIGARVRMFLAGESDELVDWLEQSLGWMTEWTSFEQSFVLADLELARSFYEIGPSRNKTLQAAFSLGEGLIGQAQLDDLLASDDWKALRAASRALSLAAEAALCLNETPSSPALLPESTSMM